jgi:hypothetical protein
MLLRHTSKAEALDGCRVEMIEEGIRIIPTRYTGSFKVVY